MKAMSQTLYIVVAAIVIMVTAIVVLAIFFPAMVPAAALADAKNLCLTKATSACAAFKTMPPDWNVVNVVVRTGDSSEIKSCAGLTGMSGCSGFNVPGSNTLGPGDPGYDRCNEPGAASRYTDCA